MILGYNLTFEQGFGQNYLLRIAYAGNEAHRLYGTGDQESGLLQLNPAIYIPGASTEANTQQRRLLYLRYWISNMRILDLIERDGSRWKSRVRSRILRTKLRRERAHNSSASVRIGNVEDS